MCRMPSEVWLGEGQAIALEVHPWPQPTPGGLSDKVSLEHWEKKLVKTAGIARFQGQWPRFAEAAFWHQLCYKQRQWWLAFWAQRAEGVSAPCAILSLEHSATKRDTKRRGSSAFAWHRQIAGRAPNSHSSKFPIWPTHRIKPQEIFSHTLGKNSLEVDLVRHGAMGIWIPLDSGSLHRRWRLSPWVPARLLPQQPHTNEDLSIEVVGRVPQDALLQEHEKGVNKCQPASKLPDSAIGGWTFNHTPGILPLARAWGFDPYPFICLVLRDHSKQTSQEILRRCGFTHVSSHVRTQCKLVLMQGPLDCSRWLQVSACLETVLGWGIVERLALPDQG